MAGPGKQIPLKMVEGKVYLRDTRNGKVHQYEDLLSNMSYMERFVFGEEPPKPVEQALHVTLSGIDRAAEWDRLASMTPEQLEAERAKLNVVAPKTEVVPSAPPAVSVAAPASTPPAPPTKPMPPAPPAPPVKPDEQK